MKGIEVRKDGMIQGRKEEHTSRTKSSNDDRKEGGPEGRNQVRRETRKKCQRKEETQDERS